MELNFDPNLVKDEIDVFNSVCEKEDPDGSYPRYDQNVNGTNFTKCNQDTEFKSELVSSSIMKNEAIWTAEESQMHYSEPSDSEEIVIKKNDFDECLYIVDADQVNNLCQENKIDIKDADNIDDFIGIEQLLLQQNQNEEVTRVYCNYCNFSSVYHGNLARHIKYKHSNNSSFQGKHECNLCDYKCAFPSDLKRHRTKHGGKPIYECYFCDYGINKKSRFHDHIFSKHSLKNTEGTFIKPKKCFVCPFKSINQFELLMHILVKHKNHYKAVKKKKNVQYFPCGLCSYVTNCKGTLIIHIDAVHKKIRLYTCHLCSYAANRPSDLRIHISAKHDKITPFKCHSCQYASAYKKHLRRHITSQHINKKIRKNSAKKNSKANVKTEIDYI